MNTREIRDTRAKRGHGVVRPKWRCQCACEYEVVIEGVDLSEKKKRPVYSAVSTRYAAMQQLRKREYQQTDTTGQRKSMTGRETLDAVGVVECLVEVSCDKERNKDY